jgi:hypothetical protein
MYCSSSWQSPSPRRGAESAYRALLCAMENARIYNFKDISRGNRRFYSTIELPKCQVF